MDNDQANAERDQLRRKDYELPKLCRGMPSKWYGKNSS